MSQDISPIQPNFLLYSTPNGDVRLSVTIEGETLWLSQKMMAELFDVDVRTVSEHLQNIFKTSELDEVAVIRNFRITATDGKNYETQFYNLDAIISVGYRVNSSRATQFRIWATGVLREYVVKWFVLDDDRLKQWEQIFGRDFFQELLERVRSIRASERRMYLKITDIFAECSTDYDKNSPITQDFFATVQNKFHYAIVWQTAAEIVHSHADRARENMWLTTWKNSPDGRIVQWDVIVAKNYLKEEEIKKLERTISGFFDYIENLIENRQTFTMTEFATSIDKFLSFNEYKILDWKWSISHPQAEKKAIVEYQEFNKTQKIHSDFEKQMKKIERQK